MIPRKATILADAMYDYGFGVQARDTAFILPSLSTTFFTMRETKRAYGPSDVYIILSERTYAGGTHKKRKIAQTQGR